jgi:hypothetical protein
MKFTASVTLFSFSRNDRFHIFFFFYKNCCVPARLQNKRFRHQHHHHRCITVSHYESKVEVERCNANYSPSVQRTPASAGSISDSINCPNVEF